MIEHERIARLFERLTAQEPRQFPQPAGHVQAPRALRNAGGLVVYVGRTTRAQYGLHQRLRNHLAGKSALARGVGGGNALRSGYTYQCLSVPNDRHRALLEHVAVGILCPKYLGLSLQRDLSPSAP